jgi:hypothetical protein
MTSWVMKVRTATISPEDSRVPSEYLLCLSYPWFAPSDLMMFSMAMIL